MKTNAKSFDMKYVHVIIVALFIVGFGYLPTFSTVTPYGMKALGCFLGIIYGWIFVGMLWTALVAFILVPFTGLTTSNELVASGFGNTVVVQVILILMMFAALEKTAIPSKITNILLGLKVCQGRPWFFLLY